MKKTFLLLACLIAVSQLNAQIRHKLFDTEACETLKKNLAVKTLPEAFPQAQRWKVVQPHESISSDGHIRKNDQLELELFDDASLIADIDRVGTNINGTTTVRARIDGYPFAYVIITTHDGRTLATIDIPEKNELFLILSEPDKNIHFLLEVNKSELNIKEPASPLIPGNKRPSQNLRFGSLNFIPIRGINDTTLIDVMIPFTWWAMEYADTWGGIFNVMAHAMAKSQLVLDNSNSKIELRLTHAIRLQDNESYDIEQDLIHLTELDFYWDQVVIARNQFAFTDLVCLIASYPDGDYAGIAWQLADSDGDPDHAFSIVDVNAAFLGYTMIQVLGNNMGCHNHKQQIQHPGPGLFSYSAGWRWTGVDLNTYCSVMTDPNGSNFPDGLDSQKVPYFSNPDIYYNGSATGHTTNGDNARTLREIKDVIADYRSERPFCPETGLSNSFGWTLGGHRHWFCQHVESYGTVFAPDFTTGDPAVQSGYIRHNQESWFETTYQGPGELSFWWKVDSEPGNDKLGFYTNGTLRAEISGDVDWHCMIFPLGDSLFTLQWKYQKNESLSEGKDCGWVYGVKAITPIFVDKSASGANDGSSWPDAYNELSAALQTSYIWQEREIWVAAGTYYPTPFTDRYESFNLNLAQQVYGGFAGNEIYRHQRNWESNETILSGDIGTIGDSTDNVYHVVNGIDSALLDGFTITGGYANGAANYSKGAGCFMGGVSPIVRNCRFTGNYATNEGGAVYITIGQPVIESCIFENNESNKGGAIYINAGEPLILNTIFRQNQAFNGAAIYSYNSNPHIDDCLFDENLGTSEGAAIYCWLGSNQIKGSVFSENNSGASGGGVYAYNSKLNFDNCWFDGNTAVNGGAVFNTNNTNEIVFINCQFTSNVVSSQGGAVYSGYSDSRFIDCLFQGNSSQNGGAIFNWCFSFNSTSLLNCLFSGNLSDYGGGLSQLGGSMSVVNSTFSGNRSNQSGAALNFNATNASIDNSILFANKGNPLAQANGGNKTFRNCNIEFSGGSGADWDATLGVDGGGNIQAPPIFHDPRMPILAPNTEGDYRLRGNSPCIDAGNNTFFPDSINTDIRSETRIVAGYGSGTPVIDMGAYEYQPGLDPEAATPRLYVKASAKSRGDGASWETAFSGLQEALDLGYPGTEIWVAAGVYKPTSVYGVVAEGAPNYDRHKHFRMLNDVAIYGGFAGTETDLDQRELTNPANETILSGDFDDDGEPSNGDAYHIFYHPSNYYLTNTALLDGFTLTTARASGSSSHLYGAGMFLSTNSVIVRNCKFTKCSSSNHGGGVYMTSVNATIFENCSFIQNSTFGTSAAGGAICGYTSTYQLINCSFTGNSATGSGGAVYNYQSHPEISHCEFISNTSNSSGGALCNTYFSEPYINYCLFQDNESPSGGAAINHGGEAVYTDCQFINNTATGTGGALRNSGGTHKLVNCAFTRNKVTGIGYYTGGGAMYNYNTSLTLINNLFSLNTAQTGGAVKNSGTSPLFINCTFSGNMATLSGASLFNESGSNPEATNSIFFIAHAASNSHIDGGVPIFTHCNIEGCGGSGADWNTTLGTDSGGNIDINPLFIENPTSGMDGIWGTPDDAPGNLRLQEDSPSVNTGINTPFLEGGVAEGIVYDLDNELRICDEITDMGAYEFQEIGDHLVLGNMTITSIETRCFAAYQTITLGGSGTTFTVEAGADATFEAGQAISIKDITRVEYGAFALFRIETGDDFCSNPESMIASHEEKPWSELISVLPKPGFLNIYPNPTTGIIMVDFPDCIEPAEAMVSIFGIQATLYYEEVIQESGQNSFDLSEYQPGVYIIRIMTGKETWFGKIIKN